MTSLHKISQFIATGLVLALSLACCQTKNTNTLPEKIKITATQLEKDNIALQNLKSIDYQQLSNLFKACDSLLINSQSDEIEGYFTSLNYADGYISQFQYYYPILEKKINYSIEQLANLNSDIESNYINDSTATAYFDDEILIADTIHEQIKYFDEKAKKMNKELLAIEKKLKKQKH